MPVREEEEELVRDEQVATSAPCFPEFSRVPSALRKMSNSSGNVLADARIRRTARDSFAIPSSDVEVGAHIGMGACCQVMRGACVACAPGTYSTTVGASAPAACLACAAGNVWRNFNHEIPLSRQRALRMPLREEEEELVRNEQVAASAPCFPEFSRVPSALRKMSNSSGNVLADAELDHCEMFAIPSSDVEVGAHIGMGACCQVMRGAWRGRPVAIKTIKICDSAGADDAAANNSKSKDIVKEIALMCRTFATMSHPNIVGFYGICVDAAQPWLIMEYVGGGSVEDCLVTKDSSCKPSRRRALTWALDLARGLHYLHSQRPVIVHRDIKPANLMLSACRENLKLCDFGVSTLLSPGKESRREEQDTICDGKSAGYLTDALYNDDAIAPSARPKEMTRRTGTYRYMAPEVFENQTPYYNSAVDIYSAAMSMWVLFKGERPFNNLDGLTVAQLAARQNLRPPLRTTRSTTLGNKKAIPSSVSQLLEGAWHSNPAERPCASDMIAVLEEVLRKEGTGILSSISSAMTGNFFQRTKSAPSALSAAATERTPSAAELHLLRSSVSAEQLVSTLPSPSRTARVGSV